MSVEKANYFVAIYIVPGFIKYKYLITKVCLSLCLSVTVFPFTASAYHTINTHSEKKKMLLKLNGVPKQIDP